MTNTNKDDLVLLLSPSPPPVGGISTWTENFLRLMKGHREIVLVNQSNIYGRKTNIYVDRIFNTLTFLKTLSIIIFLAITRNVKGTHISTSLSPYGIIREELVLRILKFLNCPTIIHVHCTIPDIEKIYDHAARVHRMLMLADHVVTLNETSCRHALANGCRRVTVVPNFGNGRTYPRTTYKQKLKKALLVGHVTRYKGLSEYLDAARKNSEIEFMIAGEIVESELLNRKTENVTYMGTLSSQALNALYRDADVFILPTYTEGFSMSLLEAMSHGLPIITTDVGANSEMIGLDGGILIERGNSSALDHAIKRIKSSDARQKAGLANLKRYRRAYSCEKVLSLWTHLYDSTFKS